MKRLILLLVLSILFNTTSIAQIHISGNVSGTLVDTTYIVDDTLYVPFGDSLLIEAGAEFLFMPDASFEIHGVAMADGIQGDSIYFHSYYPDSSWGGIDITHTAMQFSQLNYCIVKDALTAVTLDFAYARLFECNLSSNYEEDSVGGVLAQNAILDTIAINCSISNNQGHGVFLAEGGVLIGCRISSNSGRGVHSIGNLELHKCQIMFNQQNGLYTFGRSLIDSCSFKYNVSNTIGGGVHNSSAPITISNSIVQSNSAVNGGGGVYSDGRMTMNNCTIVDNYSTHDGGGICTSSTSRIKNTIVANNRGDGGVEGINLNIGIDYISYCDFYNNENGDFTRHDPDTTLSYSNENGDVCDQYFNIYIDPLFVDNANYNFELSENSPCINAGDPNSPPDPDNTITDIGYYFFNQSNIISNAKNFNATPVSLSIVDIFPNPANAHFQVRYSLEKPGPVEISVYNLLGKVVFHEVVDQTVPGVNSMMLHMNNLGSGTYFLNILSPQESKSVSQKIVLVK